MVGGEWVSGGMVVIKVRRVDDEMGGRWLECMMDEGWVDG